MNKDIVFYSNFCSFSKEIVASLSKSAIHQSLVYICVDDKNINLPNFITVVPTIYISQDRKILTDGEINKWIESQNPKKDEEEDIMAYHGNSMGVSGFSTSFSFLEEDNEIRTYIDSIAKTNNISNVQIHRNGLNNQIQLNIETGQAA